jgi:hypothetical protein
VKGTSLFKSSKILFLSVLYYLVWQETFSMALGVGMIAFVVLGIVIGITSFFIDGACQILLGIIAGTGLTLIDHMFNKGISLYPAFGVTVILSTVSAKCVRAERIRIYCGPPL